MDRERLVIDPSTSEMTLEGITHIIYEKISSGFFRLDALSSSSKHLIFEQKKLGSTMEEATLQEDLEFSVLAARSLLGTVAQ